MQEFKSNQKIGKGITMIKKLSFVIPCYNSSSTIGTIIERIIRTVTSDGRFLYEIICVNDYSPDNTFEVLKETSKG